MIDSEIEMKGLGRKHPANTHKQKIVDPNFSRKSQTSCSRKKPTGRRVWTQTHTHDSTNFNTLVNLRRVKNFSLISTTVLTNISYNLYLFWLTTGKILLKTVFADINITFFIEIWCFCLFVLACTIIFFKHILFIHELVQPYLDNKPNPYLNTSITRGRLPLISSVRLSRKYFPLSNYTVHKSCFVCAEEKNSAKKYKKTTTSNFCEKCNVCLQKLFWAISYLLSTKMETDYMIYLQWK